jgi:uncharacterized membrane protein YqjE
MEHSSTDVGRLVLPWRRLGRRLLGIFRNRLELVLCEIQEERDRLVRVILLALGVAAFGLLAAMAMSAVLVAVLWEVSRVAAFLGLAGIHGAVAFLLYRRLALTLRDWESLPETLGQLRKDRACMEGENP